MDGLLVILVAIYFVATVKNQKKSFAVKLERRSNDSFYRDETAFIKLYTEIMGGANK